MLVFRHGWIVREMHSERVYGKSAPRFDLAGLIDLGFAPPSARLPAEGSHHEHHKACVQ